MKRLIILVLMICLSAAALVLPTAAAEMRGLWVDAFHPGFKTPSETTTMVEKAKESNFNALLVQVRKRGDVYYRSDIEPMAVDVAEGYDPLADVIRKAHAAGIEVHAWITVYECYHPVRWKPEDMRLIHAKHPEWLTMDEKGCTLLPADKKFLDPGLKEVQDYLVGIAREIAVKYDVDGIHLDDIRYPLPESGYNPVALERFSKATGRTDRPTADDKQWCDWRRNEVTSLVRLIYGAVAQAKRHVKVSAAVFADPVGARDLCLQDWAGWLSEGILDFAVPMIFEDDNRAYAQVLADCLAAGKGRRHVYIGHAGWKMDSGKSLDRIGVARRAGAPGTVVFSYWYCSQLADGPGAGLIRDLKGGLFARPDSLPAMEWKTAR